MAQVVNMANAQFLAICLISILYPHTFYLTKGFVDSEFSYDVDLSPWGPEFGGFGIFRLRGMVREASRRDTRGENTQ